jgi:hypothetical protein
MPVAGATCRFDMMIVVKAVRMVMGALFLIISIVRMTNGGSQLLSLDQMDVRTTIAMVLVEKGGKAFSGCSRIEDKPSTCAARRECGSPPPYTSDPSHAAHRQCAIDRWRRFSISGG